MADTVADNDERVLADRASTLLKRRGEPFDAERQGWPSSRAGEPPDPDFALLGHELRSCLHSILMSAEVLAMPALCADFELRSRQLDGISSAVAHAVALLASAEAARAAPPGSRMMSLQAVFEAVRTELAGRAWSAGVTLVFPRSVPSWSVDAVVARLTLSNLLVNAIKYADTKKPVRWVTVRVELCEGDDPALAMEVADNGLGIPSALQQHVLLRGFRAHPQVAEGSGLGLALTREHLEHHGGSIRIVSEEGVGTTVRATLRALAMDGAAALPVGW